MNQKPNMTLSDQLGTLQAEIIEMQAREKELKAEFTAEGPGTYEGDLFDTTVFVSDRKNTAWKAIAKKLGATAQMIAGNSNWSVTTSVKCTAKKVVR